MSVKEEATFRALQGNWGMLRHRPYNGQSHTDHGERGKQLVEGLTTRDIRDCYVRAVILASSHLVSDGLYNEAIKGEHGNITENDLFGIDLNQTDPVAIAQNMSCEIEKMMDIFPNIPQSLQGDSKP